MAYRFVVIARLALAAIGAAGFTAGSTGGVQASSFSPSAKPLFTMAVEKAEPPPGWADFCAEHVSECEGKAVSPRNIVLMPKIWQTIVGVNKWVNDHIWPKT